MTGEGMTPAGWVFMILSWGMISALSAWCVYRLLKSGGKGR